MKSGCESVESKPQSGKHSIELPVLANASSPQTGNRKSRTSRWRAGFLIVLTLLMIAHVIQW